MFKGPNPPINPFKGPNKPPRLFTALATASEQRLRDFSAQNVSNTMWAFATADHFDERLFAALVRAAERRVSEFNWALYAKKGSRGLGGLNLR